MAATTLKPQAMNATTRLASKVLASTRDMTAASGDVAYTGVGFTPTSIMAIAAIATGSTVASWGFADSAKTAKAINTYVTATFDAEGSYLILLFQTNTSTFQYATVKSFDADGFTLTWTKAGSPTGTAVLQFLCFQ